MAITSVLGPAAPVINDQGAPFYPTVYYSVFGGDQSENRSDVEETIGETGLVTRFAAGINASPGTGTWTFTLMRGDFGMMSCTITGAQRKCETAGTQWFSAGDKLSIRLMGTGADTPNLEYSAAAFQIKYSIQQ